MPNTAYYTLIFCMSLINNEYEEHKKNLILNRNMGKIDYFLKSFSPNLNYIHIYNAKQIY